VFFILLALIAVAAIVAGTVTIVAEYERAVVFRLGKVRGARGPGVVVVIRGIDEIRRVTVRLVALDLPVQELITRDNVSVRVRAVVYVRVVDAVKVVVEVEDYRAALTQIAQGSLRAVVGQVSLDQLLHNEVSVTVPLKQLIDDRTRSWGVEIDVVEIKDVELPESLRQAMVPKAAD
jgi:regulator of protease activity HflC (stomatin/prohibitin superfamily)